MIGTSRRFTSLPYSRPSLSLTLSSRRSWKLAAVTSSSKFTRPSSLLAKMAIQKPAEPEEQPDDNSRYKPFLLPERTRNSDWISELELDTVTEMARQDLHTTGQPLRVLVLYGSLRKRYEPTYHSNATVGSNLDHVNLSHSSNS